MEPDSQTIETHLSQERQALKNNVAELEDRAKAAVSWRERFNSSPWLMLGVAFGCGVLLSGLRPPAGAGLVEPAPVNGRTNGRDLGRNSATGLDAILTALVTAGAGKAVTYLGDRIPESRENLDSAHTSA
jgi:hypothetical protein